MDGEHIEMIVSCWAATKLRDEALSELGRMREELYVLRQLAGGLTPLAPDGATHCPNCCNLCEHENCTETCPICNRPAGKA